MATVSIVVPVYKVEPYLKRCIDSILVQTYTDFDLILVDDGSPDNCGKICDEYAQKDSRIHVIHRENGGLSAARNSGIDWSFENSDSEWIMFVDSDDWIYQHALEYMLAICEKENVKTIVCEYTKEKQENEQILNKESYRIIDTSSLYNYPQNYNTFMIVSAWAKLYSKLLLKDIRYPVGKKYEDGFTTHKLMLQNEKTALLYMKLYHYFVRDDSITKQKWDCHSLDGIEATKERMRYFKENKMDIAYKNEINHYICDLANNYKLCRESEENKKFARKLKSELKNAINKYNHIVKIDYSSIYYTMYGKKSYHFLIYGMLRFINIIRKKAE